MATVSGSLEHNFALDLCCTSLLVAPERSLITAPLTDAVRSLAGSCKLGLLVTLADMVASDPALVACRPDWTATQDLSLHGAGWLTEGPAVVDARLLRRGKKAVVVAVELYDGHGVENIRELQAGIDGTGGSRSPGFVGRGLVTFVRIPGAAISGAEVDTYNPANWIGDVRRSSVLSPPEVPVYERIGLQLLNASAGVVEVACTSYVANSIGTINGGVQGLMFEAAAEAMCPGRVATDIQMHFLSQLKMGPVQTRGKLSRRSGDHSVVTLELLDAGAENRLLTTATVTLQVPSAEVSR